MICEVAIEIRRNNDVSNKLFPRYRLYLNGYMLCERFFPHSEPAGTMILERAQMDINPQTNYHFKLENLRENTVEIGNITISNHVFEVSGQEKEISIP